MKTFIKLIGVLFLSLGVLAACGDSKDVTTTEKDSGHEVTNENETKTESKVGTRSNPVKFTEVATIETAITDDDFNEYPTTIELSILEVVRGESAYQELVKMNQFNEVAPEGYEWALINAKVSITNSETEDYPFTIDGIMNFQAVSESGDIYSGDVVGTTEPDFSFEMYNGNTKEGYIAKLVKTGENAQLEYDDWSGDKVFFNLQ